MQTFLRFAPTAAFWIFALAAQVSGYSNAPLAIGLAGVGGLLLIWPAAHYLRQRWKQRKRPAGTPVCDDRFVPLATAVKRFGDAVPDVFESYVNEATHADKSVDGQMSGRAYRMWRIVPLQVKYQDSEQYKPLRFEGREMASLEFRNGSPVIVGRRDIESVDIAIKESDLETALARAPSTPPGGDLVSLQDAVKELYDGARNNVVIAMAVARKTEDEKLQWLAHQLWKEAPLRVRFAISNTYEPLDNAKQGDRRLVVKGGVPLLIYGPKEQVASRDIAILRTDLAIAIERLRAAGRAMSGETTSGGPTQS
jgi:hypothetical protein